MRALICLLVLLGLSSTVSCACEAVGACAPATFLILDEDALDNGLSTVENLANANLCGFGDPASCVNDDIVTDWTGRTALFSRQPTAPGTQLLIPGGQVGDEGWFTATQGFNSPISFQDYYDGNISDESDLDNTEGVFALGNNELNALVGQCVCAVVYDSDVSMIGPSEANLQGATLGLIAFQVVNVVPPGGLPESGSSSSLNDVLIELADSADVPTLCQVVPLDVQPPVITCPADIAVECSEAGGSSASNAAIITWLSSATATDNCGVPTVTHNGAGFFAASCTSSPTVVTFTATDSQGNSAQCTASLSVVDTAAPNLSGVPSDTTAECDSVPPPASVTASDVCDPAPTVSTSESLSAGSCTNEFTLVRTYTATDSCGHQASQQQTISVGDSTPPVLSGSPADITVECDAVPAADTLTAFDNCDSNPSVSLAENTAAGACDSSPVLTRTWTATDACGNSANHIQTVTTQDTTAPVLLGAPTDATVECDEPLPATASVTATDNCDVSPSVTVGETTAPASCAEESVVTRTWTALDSCGNSASFSQFISVLDTTPPVLTGTPADTTIECDVGLPVPASVTATDNCDAAPVVTLSETVSAGSCADESVVSRTWTAVDSCGNSASFVQTITVLDTTSPVLTGTPADVTAECDSVPPLASVAASDNCDVSPIVTPVETVSAGSCDGESVVTRTWTAIDACGNSASYTQTITVVDTTSPVLVSTPSDQTLECDTGIPSPAAVTAFDNCDVSPSVTSVDTTAPGSCDGEYIVTRTWTALDACGNSASYAQLIIVVDTTSPVLAGTPADQTVACDAGLPATAAVTASDNCDVSPVVTLGETVASGGCEDESVVTRTWTALDACGNSASYAQTITVVDTTPPMLVGTPADQTVECDAGIPAPAAVTASDNCDASPLVTSVDTTAGGSCASEFVVTRTWTAVDACGNSANFAQAITVVDTTAPVLLGTPADQTVECDVGVPGPATVTASDNCDISPTVTSADVTTLGSCAGEFVVTRTWTAVDACGNSASESQVFTVVDTTSPVLAGTPADQTVECDVGAPAPVAVTASDNCDAGPIVTLTDTTTPGNCASEFVVTRSWGAVDECGNTASFSQTITVVDTTPPVLVGTPGDTTVECDQALPAPASVTASDNCDGSPVVGIVEITSPGSCPAESVVTRSWTATDSCGNSASYSQMIIVIDTTSPVLAGTPSDVTAECDAIPAAATVTASDNCDSSPSVTLVETTSAGGCALESVITRKWTAVDACGNSSSFTQTITVVDTTSPVMTGTPSDTSVECDAALPAIATVTASDNCDVTPSVSVTDLTSAGACDEESFVARTFTAVDACGNAASYTQTIASVDTTAPVLVGTPADVTVECDAIPAAPPVIASDNCDLSPALNLIETVAAGSCGDESVMTRSWTAVDGCGNSATYSQTITVIDTTSPSLSGTPEDQTVECDAQFPNPAAVTASDNCDGSPAVHLAETTVPGTCSEESEVTRTWTAVDACGNSASYAQKITVVDTTSPVLAGTPADAQVECDFGVPPPAAVTASDNCDANPVVTLNETTTPGACAEESAVTRVWGAVDACGNSASYTQTLTVVDTTAPIFSSTPTDQTVECDAVPFAAAVTASDNCDISPAVNMIEAVAAGSCADESVITRTWSAVDACGNSASHVQTITVVDSTSPVLAGTPADETAECDAVPAPALVTASDNCDPSPVVSLLETSSAGSCADESVLTRAWTAVDACGNSVSFSQQITLVDSTPPTLSGTPIDQTVECDVVPSAAAVSATDNCDVSPAVNLVETVTAGVCDDDYILTRAWTALDACGNSASFAQTISVSDTTAPVLLGTTADVTVECDSSIPSAAAVTAVDNCDVSPAVTLSETTAAGTCLDAYVLTRVWSAVDSCGNSMSHTQLVTVADTISPVLAGTPNDATVECDAVPAPAQVTATDNCDGTVAAVLVESTSAGVCTDEYVLTRTWSAVDACGNSASETQTITVVDSSAPVLSGAPSDATVECDVAVPAAAALTASDNCDGNPSITLGETVSPGNCAEESLITRTWTAVDTCGNSASYAQVTAVVDTTAPVLDSIPVDVTVQCDSSLPAAAAVTASDNCDGNPTVNLVETVATGSCAGESVVTRTWTAVDACGNSVNEAQTITVVDTTSPILSGSPADATVECDAVPAAAVVVASDNCDPSVGVSHVETTTAGTCANESVLSRTWNAVDSCGNSVSYTQTISVVDTTAPVFGATPADVTVECDNIPALVTLTAFDNCDVSPSVTVSDTSLAGACADESAITRTWTAVDLCGNSASSSQTITVQDTTAPVLSDTPGDVTVQCDAGIPAAAIVTASDNCDTSPAVTLAETTTTGSCTDESVVSRTWTAVDACGNSVNYSQTITAVDTTAPTFVGSPADVTVECGDSLPAPASVTASDNCDLSPTVTLVEATAPGGCAAPAVTRTWSAVDSCGNSASYTQTLFFIDTSSPALVGTPGDVTEECDAVSPPADVTALDSCDVSPAVSLVETTTAGSCPDTQVIARTWTAVDSCGNSISHSQIVTVVDSTVPVISGVPPDDSLECDVALPAPAAVTALDNCDASPTVSLVETTSPGRCPDASVLTRTWTATDACGNPVSSAQTISLDDTTQPTLVGAPNDVTVFHDEIPPAATVSATDNCDSSPDIDFQEAEIFSDCGTATALTRTWTATDACGNFVNHAQTITIVSAPCTCPGGTCSSATFLILDEDAIDNTLSTIENLAQAGQCGFGEPDQCVNDDTVTDWTKRTPLFSRQPTAAGTQVLIPGGQVQDEGWFVATQGFNSPITNQDFYEGNIANESDLGNTDGVFPLGNSDLEALVGQCVCAVVFDSDVSMIGPSTANLQGDTLGLTAFKIIAVIPPGSIPESSSSSSLNDVLIELADPADVPGLCQIQTYDCDDRNSCTVDTCDSGTGFCEHAFVPEDENCSATIGTEVIIDCEAGETRICYEVHTSTNPELSHESICVPPNVAVTGTGSAPCTQTEHGRDASIEYGGTVFKFECNGNMEQPYSGEFCLTFDGIFEISEDNLAWVKRGNLEEETRTLGISACGSPPVISDVCTSSVTITITLDPTSSKSSARAICTDSELRAQLAEVAYVPLFYVTVVANEDDLVIATFLDSPTASASEAALAVLDRVASDDVPSCLRNADRVHLVDAGGSTLYETTVSTYSLASNSQSAESPSDGPGSSTTSSSRDSGTSDGSIRSHSSIWLAFIISIVFS